MILVISDNSALSVLAEINLLPILPVLFGKVAITQSVCNEGSQPQAPDALRSLLAEPPEWLQILPDPHPLLEETHALGAGEASSITLGWQHRDACLLILDEKRGRTIANRLGLRMIGVVAIVGQAAKRGIVNYDMTIQDLLAASFRVSPAIIEEVRQWSLSSGKEV